MGAALLAHDPERGAGMPFALFTYRASARSLSFSGPSDRLACGSHSANAVPTTFPYIHATVCDGCGVAVSAVVLKLGPCGPNFMAHNLTLGPLIGVVWLSVSAPGLLLPHLCDLGVIEWDAVSCAYWYCHLVVEPSCGRTLHYKLAGLTPARSHPYA